MRQKAAILSAAAALLLGACAPATQVETVVETIIVYMPAERTCVLDRFQQDPDRALVGIGNVDGRLGVVIALVHDAATGPAAFTPAGQGDARVEMTYADGFVWLRDDAVGYAAEVEDGWRDYLSFEVDRDTLIDMLNAGGDVHVLFHGELGQADVTILAETLTALRDGFGIECLRVNRSGGAAASNPPGGETAVNPAGDGSDEDPDAAGAGDGAGGNPQPEDEDSSEEDPAEEK